MSYLKLSGAGWLSTPDAASLDLTNFDIRYAIALSDWTPAASQTIVSKYNGASQKSYILQVRPGADAGKLWSGWSSAGTSDVSYEPSTAAVTASDGDLVAIRQTLSVSGRSLTYQTKATTPGSAFADCNDDSGWTDLGTNPITGAATSIFNSTSAVLIGAHDAGANGKVTGRIYAVVIKNAVGGSVVANPDFSDRPQGAASFADAAGRTWTFNGDATIVEDDLDYSATSSLAISGSGYGIGAVELSASSALAIEGDEWSPSSAFGLAASSALAMEGHPTSGANEIILSAATALAMDGEQIGGLSRALIPVAAGMAIEAWALIELDDADNELDLPEEPDPEPGEPLKPSPTVWVKRVIREAPDVILDDDGLPTNWDPVNDFPQPSYVDWGRLMVRVGGRDRTFYRSRITEVMSWSETEPFGSATAVVRFPQITPFEPMPSWLKDGALVDILQRKPDGTRDILWEGMVASFDDGYSETDAGLTVHCIGAIYQGDFFLRRAVLVEDIEPTDIGTIIQDIVTPYGRDRGSWRIRSINRVETGVKVLSRGGWGHLVTGFVADLLSQSWSDDGLNQWTIEKQDRRKPVMKLKDRTTEHYSIHVGDQGVSVDLTRDITTAPTTIFGEGEADNCRWYNSRYPNLRPDDAPVFFGSPLSPGDEGDNMLLFEREMSARGWAFDEDGVYDESEEAFVVAFQQYAGITADGVIGPQTWAAAFDVGSDAGDLKAAYVESIYSKKFTEKYNHTPDGAKAGLNPTFDKTKPRVERYESFGSRITKKEAMRSARLEVERDYPASYVGRITLSMDPPESSRFEIKAGRNILLRGHRGEDRLLHISQVDVDWPGQTVTLVVDEHARDAGTLRSMLIRDRDTTDPARRREVHRYNRDSNKIADTRAVFDCENGAGRIPYQAIGIRTWQVNRIPCGKLGQFVRTSFATDVPSQMAIGIFNSKITAADLLAVGTGDPLQYPDYWQQFGDELLNAWGAKEGDEETPAGWHPWTGEDDERVIHGATAHITGSLIDDASWNWESAQSPWLWVAMWVEEGNELGYNHIVGRLYNSNTAT